MLIAGVLSTALIALNYSQSARRAVHVHHPARDAEHARAVRVLLAGRVSPRSRLPARSAGAVAVARRSSPRSRSSIRWSPSAAPAQEVVYLGLPAAPRRTAGLRLGRAPRRAWARRHEPPAVAPALGGRRDHRARRQARARCVRRARRRSARSGGRSTSPRAPDFAKRSTSTIGSSSCCRTAGAECSAVCRRPQARASIRSTCATRRSSAPRGVILCSMGKPQRAWRARRASAPPIRAWGVPVVGEIRSARTARGRRRRLARRADGRRRSRLPDERRGHSAVARAARRLASTSSSSCRCRTGGARRRLSPDVDPQPGRSRSRRRLLAAACRCRFASGCSRAAIALVEVPDEEFDVDGRERAGDRAAPRA